MCMPSLTMPGSAMFVFQGRPDLNKIVGHDIAVVQRLFTQGQMNFIKLMAQFGLKVVYDLDDNVWDLPDYNPARPIFHRYRAGFDSCIHMVDAVSVSTKYLARVVEKQIKKKNLGRSVPVIVAENRILPSMFAPPPPLNTDKVVVGWAGSSSHIGDLPLIEPAVLQFKDLDNVFVNFRGIELPDTSPVRQMARYSFKLWTPAPEYGARMPQWGWDVSLAPVTNHDFNLSKSCIKMVEAGYCGIPCLASMVRPYEEFCRHNSELEWLLCTGASQFTSKLRDLVFDQAKRWHYGQLCRKNVEEHYTLNKTHEGWQQVFDAARASTMYHTKIKRDRGGFNEVHTMAVDETAESRALTNEVIRRMDELWPR